MYEELYMIKRAEDLQETAEAAAPVVAAETATAAKSTNEDWNRFIEKLNNGLSAGLEQKKDDYLGSGAEAAATQPAADEAAPAESPAPAAGNKWKDMYGTALDWVKANKGALGGLAVGGAGGSAAGGLLGRLIGGRRGARIGALLGGTIGAAGGYYGGNDLLQYLLSLRSSRQ